MSGTKNARKASNEEEEEKNETSGNVRIQNVGGSVTVLLQLAVLAFGVRHLRNILAKRKSNKSPATESGSPGFATLSTAALKLLIELEPTPYQLLDVRPRDEAKVRPLPLDCVVNIPENELRGALQLPLAAWEHRFGSCQQPDRRQVLILLASDGQKAEQAANMAASLGFSRCCVLKGGLKAFENAEEESQEAPVKWINRDALAVLMCHGHQYKATVSREVEGGTAIADDKRRNGNSSSSPLPPPPPPPPPAVLFDLRRHDERTLYGCIPNSKHLPVDRLPLALASEDQTWQKLFHFSKPSKDSAIIMQCRSNRRARWAAQLAYDAGYENCFVYAQGSFGWRLHPSVLSYNSYEEGEAPPEPIPFAVDVVDKANAVQELHNLELLPRLPR